MARRRSVAVEETFEELEQLRDYYAGTPNEQLLHLLILLKEDETRTIIECAHLANLSTRKAERTWKAYREGGVKGVVDRRYVCTQDDSEMVVKEMPFSPDVAMLNHIGKILACESMNEWLTELRSFLYRLFPEVDYISLRVLTLPDTFESGRVHTVAGRVLLPDGTQQVLSASAGNNNFDASRYLDEARRLGIPLEQYQKSPEVVEIFMDGFGGEPEKERTSIATFLFFRKKGRGPLPKLVLQRVELMRPFLSALILRFAKRRIPIDEGWSMLEAAVDRVSRERDLSITEKRVLLLVLCGLPYQEVADQVSVSISTVRSHVRSIYQKLSVSSKGETFALLFGIRS